MVYARGMGAITAEVVDTGEKRDVRGRRVMPQAQRLALIEAYRASGRTMAEFARREGINYTTLAGWIAKAGPTPAVKHAIQFAEVQVPRRATPARSAGELEVRLADGTVVRGGRVADLVALVQALRA